MQISVKILIVHNVKVIYDYILITQLTKNGTLITWIVQIRNVFLY